MTLVGLKNANVKIMKKNTDNTIFAAERGRGRAPTIEILFHFYRVFVLVMLVNLYILL